MYLAVTYCLLAAFGALLAEGQVVQEAQVCPAVLTEQEFRSLPATTSTKFAGVASLQSSANGDATPFIVQLDPSFSDLIDTNAQARLKNLFGCPSSAKALTPCPLHPRRCSPTHTHCCWLQLVTIAERNYSFAHEAGVWLPTLNNSVFFTSNRLPAAGGGQRVEMWLVELGSGALTLVGRAAGGRRWIRGVACHAGARAVAAGP